MSSIRRFEELEAWRAARELTNGIYRLTRKDAFGKDFGLRDQIRRAAVSAMANIAEGFERDGDKEFAKFLMIAKGSAGETRSLLYVAFDQDYITELEHAESSNQAIECSRLISGLAKYLRQSELKGNKFK
jgi:four helix bundle protein